MMTTGITSALHGRTLLARGTFTLMVNFGKMAKVWKLVIWSTATVFLSLARIKVVMGVALNNPRVFFGQMYGVNMWNRVLTAEEISHMSANCSYGVGNYLRWSDFVTGLRGAVTITSSATCLP